jgi:hypothetical protein
MQQGLNLDRMRAPTPPLFRKQRQETASLSTLGNEGFHIHRQTM